MLLFFLNHLVFFQNPWSYPPLQFLEDFKGDPEKIPVWASHLSFVGLLYQGLDLFNKLQVKPNVAKKKKNFIYYAKLVHDMNSKNTIKILFIKLIWLKTFKTIANIRNINKMNISIKHFI